MLVTVALIKGKKLQHFNRATIWKMIQPFCNDLCSFCPYSAIKPVKGALDMVLIITFCNQNKQFVASDMLEECTMHVPPQTYGLNQFLYFVPHRSPVTNWWRDWTCNQVSKWRIFLTTPTRGNNARKNFSSFPKCLNPFISHNRNVGLDSCGEENRMIDKR